MNATPRTVVQTAPSIDRPERPPVATRMALLGLIVAPLLLAACGDPAPTPVAPKAADVGAADIEKDRKVTSGIASDPSVPSAEAALAPPAGDPQAIEGPALAPLTKEEESQAMPKDGQANDHSSPKVGS